MKSRLPYVIVGSLLILTFFLILEHRAHIFGNSQYLLFAAFIGLHLFMHVGHGGDGKSRDQKNHDSQQKGGGK